MVVFESGRMVKAMKIACLQINPTVGDFSGNVERLIRTYEDAVEAGADLAVGPELALCGYPPRDLLQFRAFTEEQERSELELAKAVGAVPLIVGALTPNPGTGKAHYNSAIWIEAGAVRQRVHKWLLPTYDVFDEERYFEPGRETRPVEWNGCRIGLTVCEDIWKGSDLLPRPLYDRDPVAELISQGAEVIINVSASPWSLGKGEQRREIVQSIARQYQVPAVQCNQIGGNDELIFDGQSVIVSATGDLVAEGAGFMEDVLVAELNDGGVPWIPAQRIPEEDLYHALCLGTRDYVRKCGFDEVVIGLSGGIDSAVTAAVAAGALGPEKVMGVLMPSGFSSEGSITDAEALVANLGIVSHTLPITPAFSQMRSMLEPVFHGREEDITEENIQARLRGILLMAISNKLNRLVLTTGNKSELAVGYCTLYGDMCGGLSVINDVPKTWVYRLARWLNRDQEVIPVHTIEKPPSAELRPDQKDEDSLPPYDVLDDILERYVEGFHGVEDIAREGGHDPDVVRKWLRQVDVNEYKRRQAAPGLKVTSKAFGIGRRMPVAQKFRHR